MAEPQPRPQLRIVIFGDGTEGILLSIKEADPDDEGIPQFELKVKPSQDMQYMYGIPTEELVAKRWVITTTVPQSKVYEINRDSRVGRVLVLCGLYGKPTMTEHIFDILLDQVRSLQRDREAKMIEIAHLYEDRKRLTTQTGMYMKDLIEDLVKPAFSVRYGDYASHAPPGTTQTDDGMGERNE